MTGKLHNDRKTRNKMDVHLVSLQMKTKTDENRKIIIHIWLSGFCDKIN